MNNFKEFKIVRRIWFFLVMLLSVTFVNAQDATFAGPAGCGTTGSSGTWTVPCDVTSITVEVYGGGGGAGGGGGGSDGGIFNTEGGGGAGGGGYTTTTIDVTPGSSFSYNAAPGGCGGGNGSDFSDGDNGGGGGTSTFSGTDASGASVSLTAGGGGSGEGGESGGSPGSGGFGGTASGGSTNISGVSGNSGSGGDGGAGGAGAGTNGGSGGSPDGGNGASYGGGGAGGGNSNGGNGGAGGILITYVTQGDFTPEVVVSPASCLTVGTGTISNYNIDATYSFTPVGPAVGNGGVVSGTVVGTSYTVISTIGTCLSPASQAFSVEEQLAGPVISISGMLEYCAGSLATITGGGGQSYVWDDSNNSATASIDVAAGTYTVTGTDAAGCTGSSTVVVVEVANPSVDLGEDQSVCGQAVVSLDAGSGPTSYNWSSGDDAQIVELGSGTHWVEVSNGTCIATDTVVVVANLNPEPQISPSGSQSICNGGDIELDAGAGYSTYVWSPNSENTQTIIVDGTGTYSAIVTDANGCVGSSDTVTVTIEDIADITILASGPVDLCEGESVTLDAGAGSDTYLWSNGDTTQTTTVLVEGDYSVSGTQGGCSFESDTVAVSVSEIVVIITESGLELSVPSTFTSYQWFLNGAPIPGATGPNYTATSSGNYTVQVIDANGCTGLSFILEYTLPSSVNELQANLPFVIYPNPSNGQFQLSLDLNESYSIVVFNSIAQKVYETEKPNGNRTEISLETTGVYIVQVTINGSVYHKRIVVE